ncbi:hypothetical protein Sbal175_4385 (plasmid) [Shewanella baltica BA175]|nr:hypothetical protein Sbal175_4385 [Shewanella baltica BA175]
MESSQITNQEVINLGKAIIAELGMKKECNTPARWLVHYIAENIHKSENSQGQEKKSAERNCVDAIFKLWHHRSELPRGISPFTEFAPVFRGLSRLDNSSQRPYYNEFSQFGSEIEIEAAGECKHWVDTAISIDKAAKTLVAESFELAANTALTEKSKKILSLAPDKSEDDIRVMLSFMYDDNPEQLQAKEIERIQSKIQSITALKSICDIFIDKLNEDLPTHTTDE